MIRAFGQTQLHFYREGHPPDVTRMSETKLKIGCFLCLCLKECRRVCVRVCVLSANLTGSTNVYNTELPM